MNLRVLHAYWQANGIPLPVAEYEFHPDRKWRFDYAWLDKRVALEIQGGIWKRTGRGAHTGTGAVRDIEKFTAAAVLGWRILYSMPEDLFRLDTAQAILAALAWNPHG